MNTDSSNGQLLKKPQQAAGDDPISPVFDHVNVRLRQPVVHQPRKQLKKNKVIWLCVTLGAILILVGIISCMSIKTNADKVADSYVVSLKSYLNQVYDKVNIPSASALDIKDSLSKLNKPKLSYIFLGTLSFRYTNAQTLMVTSDDKLKPFDKLMTDFIAVYSYQQLSQNLITKWESEHKPPIDYSKSMDSYLKVIKQIKLLVEKTQVPDDLKSDFINISKKIDDMVTAFTTMILVYKTGDQVAFKSANNNFISMSNEETLFEEKVFNAYYSSLSIELINSVKGLKIYSASIK